jgi:hypothetical protein
MKMRRQIDHHGRYLGRIMPAAWGVMMLAAAPVIAQDVLPTVNVPNIARLPAQLKTASQPAIASEMSLDEIIPTQLTYDQFGASLFYSERNMRRLKAALAIAKSLANRTDNTVVNTQEEDAFLLAAIAPEPINLSEYPVFHLSSIVHHGPGKWVMWLNGKRVTPATLPANIKVLSLRAGGVRLQWQPESYDALSMHWQAMKGNAIDKKLASLKSHNSPVVWDEEAQILSFWLRPNQTYVSAFNQVLEGKVNPTPVSATVGEVNISAFERTLRQASTPDTIRPQGTVGAARVVRPGAPVQRVAPTPAVIGSNRARAGASANNINQVPAIFPGGVPAGAADAPSVSGVPNGTTQVATPAPTVPLPEPPANTAPASKTGLPILPEN